MPLYTRSQGPVTPLFERGPVALYSTITRSRFFDAIDENRGRQLVVTSRRPGVGDGMVVGLGRAAIVYIHKTT